MILFNLCCRRRVSEAPPDDPPKIEKYTELWVDELNTELIEPN